MSKMYSLKKILLSTLFMLACSVSILQGTTRIMPLGDSITWDWYYGDERLDSERSGYRNYLWYKLRDTGYDANFVGSKSTGEAIDPYFDGDNEGYTAWQSYEIAEYVYHFLETNPPDVILLHIGTNDFQSSTAGVEEILNEVDRFEIENDRHIKVILASVINMEERSLIISDFNENIDAMARNRIDNGDDIQIVDMEYGAGIDYHTDMIDGIHPNDCGYEKMANVWFSALTGRSSPELKFANCSGEDKVDEKPEGEEDEESLDELYAYPETLAAKEYIISSEVDEETRTVTFIVEIPESGITF